MNSLDQRIENQYYDDKTKQMKFISARDPYGKLAEILGKEYINYRKKWTETSKGKDILEYPLHLDIAINDTCNIKCHFCPHSLPVSERNYKPTGNSLIPLDLFEEIIKDGVKHGLKALSFGPISEPLLVKDLYIYIYTRQSKQVL